MSIQRLIKGSLITGLCLLGASNALAEIDNKSAQDKLRLRVGTKNSTVNTVYFNVVGSTLGDGTLTNGSNNNTSTNQTTTPIVHVIKNYGNNANPVHEVRVDSATPMICSTPATCNTQTIPLSTVSWTGRAIDAGVWDTVTSFNDSSNQLVQTVEDTNPNNKKGVRYRIFARFTYDNSEFLPAGMYEGIIQVTQE